MSENQRTFIQSLKKIKFGNQSTACKLKMTEALKESIKMQINNHKKNEILASTELIPRKSSQNCLNSTFENEELEKPKDNLMKYNYRLLYAMMIGINKMSRRRDSYTKMILKLQEQHMRISIIGQSENANSKMSKINDQLRSIQNNLVEIKEQMTVRNQIINDVIKTLKVGCQKSKKQKENQVTVLKEFKKKITKKKEVIVPSLKGFVANDENKNQILVNI